MSKIYLKESTRDRLPKSVPDDLAVMTDECVVFLTHIFKNGYLLGWYSHSPWGNVRDQETGWWILDTDLNMVDVCPVRTDGQPAGEDFRAWLRDAISEHGKRTKLSDEDTGELIWRLSVDA